MGGSKKSAKILMDVKTNDSLRIPGLSLWVWDSWWWGWGGCQTLRDQSDLSQQSTYSERNITWLCSVGGAAHQQRDLSGPIFLVCYQTGSEPWLSYSIGSSLVCFDHTYSCLAYLFARAISLCSLVRSHSLLGLKRLWVGRKVFSELVKCHNLAGTATDVPEWSCPVANLLLSWLPESQTHFTYETSWVHGFLSEPKMRGY